MPRVSVIVSHYDRQALLLEALDSIAGQTYRDFEVIVVNDHGADSGTLVEDFTARLARHGAPVLVRYDYRPANAGVAAARNRGVALANGELIAYLDDDDLWRPDHLSGLVGILEARPDAGLAYADAEICRVERTMNRNREAPGWRCAEARILAVPFDREDLARDGFIVPGAMLHRRALYDAVGPFDETLGVSDDWEWLLRAAAISTFVRLPRVVITVRIWPDRGNLSARIDARRLAALAEIERRHGTPPLVPKTFWEVAETYARRDAERSPTPRRLLELATAYQQSEILFAFLELDLASWLAASPRSIEQVGAELGAHPVAAERFLDACVALGLLVRDDDGAVRNAPESERFLVRGTPHDLRGALGHYDRAVRREAWNDLVARLRAWRPGATADGHVAEDSAAEREGLDQHRLALLAGDALAHVLDLSAHRRLADLGGGTGAMSIALGRRFPELTAVVLDRPQVARLARTSIAESGLGSRIDVIAADFLEEPLPSGSDAVLLANVLSMLSAETARALFRRLFAELPPGGLVAVSGWMPDEDRTRPLLSVLLGLEDIALGASDVEHGAATYAAWLADAGFVAIETRKYFDPATVVIARKK